MSAKPKGLTMRDAEGRIIFKSRAAASVSISVGGGPFRPLGTVPGTHVWRSVQRSAARAVRLRAKRAARRATWSR